MKYQAPIRGKIKKIETTIEKTPFVMPAPERAVGSMAMIASEIRSLNRDTRETIKNVEEKVDKKLEQVDDKLEEVNQTIKEIKLTEKGEDGKDADEQKIADFVISQIRDWVTSQVIPQIRQPKDGISPDPEAITRGILKRIQLPDEDRIVERVSKRIPKPKPVTITERVEIDPISVIDKVLNHPRFKVKPEQIDGLQQTMDSFRSQLGRGYLHGGGDTVEAGTGITITDLPSGKKRISTSSSASGITRSISSVAINTNAGSTASTDYVYLVSGTTTITLPTAVGNTNLYTIKRVGVNTVTVATTGGQTIDGSASASINVQYVSLDFISDGTNWCVV